MAQQDVCLRTSCLHICRAVSSSHSSGTRVI